MSDILASYHQAKLPCKNISDIEDGYREPRNMNEPHPVFVQMLKAPQNIIET